jgi:hypothetical protein
LHDAARHVIAELQGEKRDENPREANDKKSRAPGSDCAEEREGKFRPMRQALDHRATHNHGQAGTEEIPIE